MFPCQTAGYFLWRGLSQRQPGRESRHSCSGLRSAIRNRSILKLLHVGERRGDPRRGLMMRSRLRSDFLVGQCVIGCPEPQLDGDTLAALAPFVNPRTRQKPERTPTNRRRCRIWPSTNASAGTARLVEIERQVKHHGRIGARFPEGPPTPGRNQRLERDLPRRHPALESKGRARPKGAVPRALRRSLRQRKPRRPGRDGIHPGSLVAAIGVGQSQGLDQSPPGSGSGVHIGDPMGDLDNLAGTELTDCHERQSVGLMGDPGIERRRLGQEHFPDFEEGDPIGSVGGIEAGRFE